MPNRTGPNSILPLLLENQRRAGTEPRAPRAGDRWAFFIFCKDRFQYTLQTVASLDSEPGFDLFWIDSSETPEGRALPYAYKPRFAHVREIYTDLRGADLAPRWGLPEPKAGTGVGGSNAALCQRFALERLVDLGYDYIGMVESDVIFRPGWFTRLKEAMAQAAADGLAVGYADVRTYTSRLIEMRRGYGIYFAGASTAVFTREAAKVAARHYGQPFRSIGEWMDFYQDRWGLNLRTQASSSFASEFNVPPAMNRLALERSWHSEDWWFAPHFYAVGLNCIGSIPAYCYDLEIDPELAFDAPYAGVHHSNRGLIAALGESHAPVGMSL